MHLSTTITTQDAMDRMYRYQRHLYDLTRKYYLFGRDQLLTGMKIRPGDRVVEIGCGTARNLIILAEKHPRSFFYGVDISREMLATAQKNTQAAGLSDRICLQLCGSEDLDYQTTFRLETPFDSAFFSYSLSMMPDWRGAVERAVANVRAGGNLFLVDFCDQAHFPTWFRYALVRWLKMFGVHYHPEYIEYFQALATATGASLEVNVLFRRYAFWLRYQKNSFPAVLSSGLGIS